MKVTTIEEAQDICTIEFDEIIGFLLTFEMATNDKYEKRNKSVASKADVEDDEEQVEEDIDVNLIKCISLLEKIFGKVMRILGRISRNNDTNSVKDNLPHNAKCFNSRRKGKEEDRQNKCNGIQFHECKGFWNVHTKCTNFLRKQKKGYNATFSDDKSDEESESEQAKNMVAFIAHVISRSTMHNDAG